MRPPNWLEADALRRAYGPPKGAAAAPAGFALDLTGLRVAVGPGQILCVEGHSGSGKSTLLALLGLLERPDAGAVRLFGRDVTSAPEHERAALRRDRVGVMVHRAVHLRGLTVIENVTLPLVPLGLGHAEMRRRGLAVLDALALGGRADTAASVLSAGEAQRAALGRALVHDPDLALLDEPLAHLDAAAAAVVRELVLQRIARGKAVVVTSLDDVWDDVCHAKVRIKDGRPA